MADTKVNLFDDGSWRYFISLMLGVKSGADEKIDKKSIVTSLTSGSTDTEVPSAKLAYTELEKKIDKSSIEDGYYTGTSNTAQTNYTCGDLNYTVKNGWCIIPRLQITCNTSPTNAVKIASGFPIPYIETSGVQFWIHAWGNASTEEPIGLYLNLAGELHALGGSDGVTNYFGSIIYPISS